MVRTSSLLQERTEPEILSMQIVAQGREPMKADGHPREPTKAAPSMVRLREVAFATPISAIPLVG